MFFIGILGVDNKTKEIKDLDNLNCKICDSVENMKLIKNYSYFHIFFIPIIKWNVNYYISCSKCNSIFKLKEEKGKLLERGDNIEITYWDLEEISNNHNKNICNNCGAKIEDNYTYCPFCGERKYK